MFLNTQQLADRYGVSRVTVWRWGKTDPTFPKAVKLSDSCTRWRLSEIEEWEASKENGGEAA